MDNKLKHEGVVAAVAYGVFIRITRTCKESDRREGLPRPAPWLKDEK